MELRKFNERTERKFSMRFTDVPLNNDEVQSVQSLQMLELSDEELSAVTGGGGSAANACGSISIPTVSVPSVGSCGSCGASMSSGPLITAFSNTNNVATRYSTSVSLATSNNTRNNFLSLAG